MRSKCPDSLCALLLSARKRPPSAWTDSKFDKPARFVAVRRVVGVPVLSRYSSQPGIPIQRIAYTLQLTPTLIASE